MNKPIPGEDSSSGETRRPIGEILEQGDESIDPRSLSSPDYRFRLKGEIAREAPLAISQEEVIRLFMTNRDHFCFILDEVVNKNAFNFYSKHKNPSSDEDRGFWRDQKLWEEQVCRQLTLLQKVVAEEVAKSDLVAERFIQKHPVEIENAKNAIKENMPKCGVQVPSDLFERINFCGEWTYLARRIKEESSKGEQVDPWLLVSVGYTNPITGEIDIPVSQRIGTEEETDLSTVISAYIHEVLHKLSINYFWGVTDQTTGQTSMDIKRSGLLLTDPRFGARMGDLNEAVVETLTRQICVEDLNLADYEPHGYDLPVEALETMTEQIPLPLFIKGAFTSKGFRDLYMAFEKKYGHFSLFAFAKIIYYPDKVEQFITDSNYRNQLLLEEKNFIGDKRKKREKDLSPF